MHAPNAPLGKCARLTTSTPSLAHQATSVWPAQHNVRCVQLAFIALPLAISLSHAPWVLSLGTEPLNAQLVLMVMTVQVLIALPNPNVLVDSTQSLLKVFA